MQVYKIGVELMMLGNFTAAISALGKNLLGINSQVKQLTGSFGGLKAAITGALTAYAGVKTLDFLGKMAKHGNEIVHQQELMRIAGLSQQEIAEATAKAYETSAKVQTTTIAENLKHLRELRYAFGDLAKAQAALDQVSKVNSVLQTLTGTDSDEVWQLVKAIEIKGPTIDPKLFADYIDKMNQVIVATGGKVTPGQYFSTFKYGRTAMQGWDEDFIMGALPRSIQSMSGGGGSGSGSGGPGNALMSAFGEIIQGKMTKPAAEEFARIGIGTAKGIRGSSFSLTDVASKNLMMHNPYEWVQQVLMPALHAKGIDSQEAIVAEIGKLFPNRTAGQIMTEYGLQGRYREGAQSQFEKDIALQKQSMKANDAFQSLMNNDLAPNMKAFTAQWNSMLEALGAPTVPLAIAVLRNFTDAFTGITKFAQANPEAIANIAKGIGVLGAALMGGTIVAIAAFIGPVGWFAAGIGALGAALVLWGPKVQLFLGPQGIINFGITSLGEALSKYDWKSAFANLISSLGSLWDKLKGWMHGDSGVQPGQLGYTGDGSGLLHQISYGPSGGAGFGSSSSTGGGAVGRRLIGGSPSTGGGAGAGNIARYGNLAMGGGDVNAAIAAGAAAAGMDVPHFKAMASIESSLNPTSNWNRSTQYKGLFQIGRSEWRLHGHGNIYNAMDNALAMAALVNANKAFFRKHFGRDPTADEIYLMHQQGPGFYTRGALTNPGGNWPRSWGPVPGHAGFERGWSGEVERRARIFGGAVPPPKSASEIHVHNSTILDGRVIAHNSMKHIASGGEKGGSGGRLYDRSYTRPISI